MRKSRDEKTIEHSSIVLDDLEKIYNTDSSAYTEYKRLFDEYKTLAKRFNRTINISDSTGKNVLEDNEQLKENVTYTVEKAKAKILHNISEHKKTKEVLAKHSESDKEYIRILKKELKDMRTYTQKLEQDLNKSDSVNHQFYETFDPIIKSKDINNVDIGSQSFKDYLQKKLNFANTKNEPLCIAKLSIDEFLLKREQLDDINNDKEGLVKTFYKYFSVSLGSKHSVYYFSDNLFYIILSNITIEKSRSLISKINIPRKLSDVVFTFSVGITEFQSKNDNLVSLIRRCDDASKEASKELTKNSVIFN